MEDVAVADSGSISDTTTTNRSEDHNGKHPATAV